MSASGQPVGGLYVKISGDTSDLDRDMNRARREMERTEQQSQSLISSTQALEGAFVAAGAAAVGLSAGLGLMAYRYSAVDQQLAQIQGSTQATTAQMDSMRQQALQLGEDLPISLTEATTALHSLTTAGLSASEATEALSATANLAAVGELKMAEAATTTVGVLNAFNLEASRASAAADTIAAASASSTADIQGMADALRESSSAATQLGVSSQEVSAFVATLSAAGVEASTAGSSINDALSSLASPSQEARTALASAGLAIDDFRTKSGDLKDMVDVLALLRDNLSGMSEERQRAILSNVFGDSGGRAVGQAIDRLDEYKQSLAEVSRAQVSGGISRLGDLSDQELSQRQQEVGFNLQPGSTRDVLEQYRQLAQNEGLSQDELSTNIEVGLNISPRAADLLAGDLTSGTDMGNLVAGIENADTAAGRASEGMDTFRGRVSELGGTLDTFFYKVYQGAKGPMSAMLAVLNPIADVLAQNDEVAYALGMTMVGLAGAATAAAIALGMMYAELVLVEGALLSAMATTTTYSYVTAALSPAQLAAAASSITLSGALATVSGALSAAAGAALSFWAAIGPIGWVILGLIGLFAAWKSGLLDFIGLGSEADAVVESLMWALGGLADALGGAGGALGGVVGWLVEFLGVALRASTLGLVITIKALGVALRYLGDAIDAILSPFESLWNVMTGSADAADWLTVALLAIPGGGVIAWALDAAGAFDTLSSPIDAAAQAGEDLAGALGGLGDVAMAILSPFASVQNIMDGTASSADWLTAALLAIPGGGVIAWALDAVGAVDEIAAAFERARQAGQEFIGWLDPRGEGQSWADWLNPLPDSGSSSGGGGGGSDGSSGPGGGGGGLFTTSADQTAAATGGSSGPPSGGSNSVNVAHSPAFNIDLGIEGLGDLGELDDQIGDMTDQAIGDLKREIETQFFRFETGQ